MRSISSASLLAAVAVTIMLSGGCLYSPLLEERWRDFPEDGDVGFVSSEGAEYSLCPVGSVGRGSGPADLGAITYAADDMYYAASDSDGLVCQLKLSVDANSGRIRELRCVRTFGLEGCLDVEGLAFDPLTQMLWAADEYGNAISGHRVSDGKRLQDVLLPPCYQRCRSNLSLESLTIREDGLEMWTCNEAPLNGDGELSTKSSTSLVRLSRFVRPDCLSPWKSSGQWAYPIGRLHGGAFRGVVVRGVADLCVLSDGTLLVLEREFSWNVIPCFRCRIYQVSFSGATEVSSRKTLVDADVVPVSRRRLWSEDTSFCNYEGMCVGKTLADGSRVLLLISDGDDHAGERIFSFKLKRTTE